MKRFYGNWKNLDDVIGEFEQIYSWDDDREEKIRACKKKPEWKGVKILFAAYETGSYEGDALVFFTQDGNLYEAHGGHCSCYGLEDQWKPEETTVKSILHRLDEGSTYGIWQSHNREIRECLGLKTVGYVASVKVNVTRKKDLDKIKRLVDALSSDEGFSVEMEIEKV